MSVRSESGSGFLPGAVQSGVVQYSAERADNSVNTT